MPPYFHVSCARFDTPKELLETFFLDVSDSVRKKLRRPGNERVGFYDRRSFDSGAEWAGDLAASLRESKALVCLISPNFFLSERCGQEWQLFQTRVEAGASDSGHAIIPVPWIPIKEIPPGVAAVFNSQGNDFAGFAEVGALRMLQSPPYYSREYPRLVESVSEAIVVSITEFNLPPMTALPTQECVGNAFAAEQLDLPSNASALSQPKMKAVIVEDHDQVRRCIVDTARLSNFEVEGYDEGEKVILHIFNDPSGNRVPDLFVIDLELKSGRMQGMKLIAEIAERNVHSAVLAVSGNMASDSLLQAIQAGALDTATKPFDLYDLLKRMKRLALVGRKRKVHSETGKLLLSDADRVHRPVFLSYSNEDRTIANGLRVNIETKGIPVWYAPTTLQPGADWHQLIQMGIDEAKVFIALITPNYLKSSICVAEFIRFYERLETKTDNPPILLCVLYPDPSILNSDFLIKNHIQQYQWVHMSPERIVDAYTHILWTVQGAVKRSF